MSIFLGIGFGPIQTGIFLSGAEGHFKKLIVAEIDNKLVQAVRNAGGRITINIAGKDKIYQRTISGIEIYNPLNEDDLIELIELASFADELCTALPGVSSFAKIAGWLKKAFDMRPEKKRFIYTAENHNYAAELLKESIGGEYRKTFYLNTVIGKMSGVFSLEECSNSRLTPICEGADRGHLVEEFNKILISRCPGIEKRKIVGLYVKDNLLPYEEAKLYGHNAVHFLLGIHALHMNLNYMHEISKYPDIISKARTAFIMESGTALLKKWKNENDFFSSIAFKNYADDLIERMLNPFLADSVNRICRDIGRKLGWDDRLIGTIRLCLSQGVKCENFLEAAKLACEIFFKSSDSCEIRKRLLELWGGINDKEKEDVISLILRG